MGRQGRKSRHRSADDVEHLVRLNWAQGIHKFFITDDNFARNQEWEAIFDRLIELREKGGIPLGLMIQVDTLCHKIENFITKAKRAGVTRVFIGLENINPDNLISESEHDRRMIAIAFLSVRLLYDCFKSRLAAASRNTGTAA